MSDHAFSANVSLTLTIAGRDVALSHVAPDYFIVQDDCGQIPAGDAELVVRIDDYLDRAAVQITDPILGQGSRIHYVSRVETQQTLFS